MMLSIFLFHLLLSPIQVTMQHFQKQYDCATFTHNESSPRIMITGGTGNIGNALATKLKQMKFTSVKIISDNGLRQHNDHLIQMNRIQTYHQGSRDVCVGDLSIQKSSRILFVNADWVIHLANSNARHNFEDRSTFLHRYLNIDSNVLKAVHHNNVSKYVYVGMAHDGLRDPSIAHTESDIYPKHPAGWGKLLGEYEVSLIGNVDTSFLELFDVYGADSTYSTRDASSPDISSMIYRAIIDSTGSISITHGLVRKKDYVFVDDVVNALVSTVKKGGFKGSLQIGSGQTIDLQNVTDHIVDLTRWCLKKNITMNFRVDPDIFAVQDAANVERSQMVLSWAPMTPLKLGIAMNYAWILKDMVRRNDTTDEQQLLQYARCLDDIVTLERDEDYEPSIIQPRGYNVVFSPPPGLISTVLPKFFCPNDRQEILNFMKDYKAPNKTLVILTTSTRAHHITFQNFKMNVLNVLDADLALSVETQKYPIPDGYRSAAKYIWEINPPKDFDFMHFYDQISTKCFNHRFNESYAQIIGTVGNSPHDSGWLGCIKAAKQNTCCAQMLFYRWFALQNILKEKLYLKYDTVIVSRSDFYWVGPHEKLDIKRGNVYVPEGANYEGLYDRHYVLSMYDAISALGHAEIVVEREDPYEQKNYLISQGCNKGVNLEFAHFIWLTNILKLKIIRYHHSGLLVTDASDEIQDRWGIRTLKNINGFWLLVKYVDELEPLRRFNVIYYRSRKFSIYNMYLTAKMYFGF